MLFVVVLIAFVMYAVLYVLWKAASGHIAGSTTPILRTVTESLLMPDNLIFTILRGLIMVTLFYLVADFLFSSARRSLRRRKDEPKALIPTYHEDNSQIYRDDSRP